jgi:hypothetical protein
MSAPPLWTFVSKPLQIDFKAVIRRVAELLGMESDQVITIAKASGLSKREALSAIQHSMNLE